MALEYQHLFASARSSELRNFMSFLIQQNMTSSCSESRSSSVLFIFSVHYTALQFRVTVRRKLQTLISSTDFPEFWASWDWRQSANQISLYCSNWRYKIARYKLRHNSMVSHHYCGHSAIPCGPPPFQRSNASLLPLSRSVSNVEEANSSVPLLSTCFMLT